MDFLPLLLFLLPIGLFFSSAMWSSFSSSTIAAEHRDRVREVRAQVLRERLQSQQRREGGLSSPSAPISPAPLPSAPPPYIHPRSAPSPSAPPLSPPPSSIPYPEGMASFPSASSAFASAPAPSASASSPRPAPTAPRADGPSASRDCPICLDRASFAVETNCAHVYCAECILEYYERGGGGSALLLQPVVCPCCRRRVDALMTRFTAAEEGAGEMAGVLQKVQGYNSRFSSQPRSLRDSFSDTPTYLRRMGEELRRSPMGVVFLLVRTHFFLSLLGGVLYVMSPIDLLPELAMGILGLVDDALVILVVCVVLASIYRTVTMQRMAQRT